MAHLNRKCCAHVIWKLLTASEYCICIYFLNHCHVILGSPRRRFISWGLCGIPDVPEGIWQHNGNGKRKFRFQFDIVTKNIYPFSDMLVNFEFEGKFLTHTKNKTETGSFKMIISVFLITEFLLLPHNSAIAQYPKGVFSKMGLLCFCFLYCQNILFYMHTANSVFQLC